MAKQKRKSDQKLRKLVLRKNKLAKQFCKQVKLHDNVEKELFDEYIDVVGKYNAIINE